MPPLLLTIAAFVTAILILVSLHELGHYTAARLCGVKVRRFSVGFGKPFYTKKRGETEWCLAPIPLGGYVKMVDTREGNVEAADVPFAFDKQHPAKKILIVAAGPLVNLILAVLLYAFSFSFGISELRPLVGTVEPGSIAEQAGFQAADKIRSVNGKSVATWSDAQTAIVFHAESETVTVGVDTENGTPATRTIKIAGTPAAEQMVKENGHIGLLPFKLTTTLAAVADNSAAVRAGLQAGDKLLSADGIPLSGWQEWQHLIRSSAGQKLAVAYERGGELQTAYLRPDSVETPDGKLSGRAGFAPERDKSWDNAVRYRHYPEWDAAVRMAFERTVGYMDLTLRFFGKLITGQASTRHISGPLTIADVAGKSAAIGWQHYIEFLALVSVSLGIMNLLPVPVLDGGHLVYYAAEWIRGKPLSERIQNIGLRLGMAVMLMLMFLAFFNDITRLIG